MKVQVLLTLDVTDCDDEYPPASPEEMKRLSADAMRRLIKACEEEGHVNDMTLNLTILLEKVEVFHIDGFRDPENV